MSETFTPSFLGGDDTPASEIPAADAAAAPAEAPAPAAAPVAEPAAAADPEGPARGADGKFVKAITEPAPVAAPAAQAAPAVEAPVVAAPVAAATSEPSVAPIAALLDERDKRQAAERRAEAAEQQAREAQQWRQQQEQQAKKPPPDPDKDPIGHLSYLRAQDRALIDAQIHDQRLEFSRTTAEIRHGAETVEKAFTWGVDRCNNDPHFNQKVQASRDPVGLVVEEWRRDQMLTQLGSDPNRVQAFLAWEAAQKQDPAAQAQAAAAAPATPTQPAAAAPAAAPVAPRPSLAAAAAAGSAGADTRIADGAEVFDGMFSR